MNRRRTLRRRIPTSGAIDDLSGMNAISSLRDEEVDELLAGHAPDGRRELAPIAEVSSAWITGALGYVSTRRELPGDLQARLESLIARADA